MANWGGPVFAALVAVVASELLHLGLAESRLLKRAHGSLKLAADRAVGVKNRAALRASANADIKQALELRRTGRGMWLLTVSAAMSWAAVVILPLLARTAREPRSWLDMVLAIEWIALIVSAVVVTVVALRLAVRRSSVLDLDVRSAVGD